VKCSTKVLYRSVSAENAQSHGDDVAGLRFASDKERRHGSRD